VPQSAASSRGPQPAPSRPRSRDEGVREGSSRRRERNALWQDSSVFQDSFFAPDNRLDASSTGEFPPSRQDAGAPPPQASAYGDNLPDDLSGVVVESEPRYPGTGTHH